jgi:NADPH-dependent 2,4-dienoyl-CoA reductase/sulfur reductase-like enzyme/nitrite reductase/ring-hydroxylating ferredoxin subunit
MAERWQKVARESDLQPRRPVAVQYDDQELYLMRLEEGGLCACGNKCTHYGGTLTDGVLSDGVFVCPWHNAHFEAATGRMLLGPALDDLPSYEVRVRNGDVLVRATKPAGIPMPKGRDARTFLIAGGGAAANAAAEMLRRRGFAGAIRMITPEPDPPYDRTMLSKTYLAGQAEASAVPLRNRGFYERLRIEILAGRKVTGLDPDRRRLTLDDGERLSGDRILLATGGVPRTLPIPGADLPGVFLLRSFADCNALIAAAREAKRAVVIGASFIGLEAAAALSTRGVEVHVVGPEEVPMAGAFGERIGRRLQRLHEEKGVRFHLGTTPRELAGSGRAEAVLLEDGSRLPADLVLIGVGIEPAVRFLEGTGLLAGEARESGAHPGGAAGAIAGTEGSRLAESLRDSAPGGDVPREPRRAGAAGSVSGVPVSPRLETTAPGVFAAGDIARVPDARTGEPLRVEHWTVAERHGQHAAGSMLDAGEPYLEVPFFWTRHYDTSLKYIGMASSFDRVAFRGDVDGGAFLAGYYQGGALRAAAAVGSARPFIRAGQLIRRGLSVSPEQFEDRSFDLAAALRGG